MSSVRKKSVLHRCNGFPCIILLLLCCCCLSTLLGQLLCDPRAPNYPPLRRGSKSQNLPVTTNGFYSNVKKSGMCRPSFRCFMYTTGKNWRPLSSTDFKVKQCNTTSNTAVCSCRAMLTKSLKQMLCETVKKMWEQ